MADTPSELAPATPSTKPYFLRALYEWCTDNGFTPYVAVVVDSTTRVPNEYVKDGQIVLNVSFDATSNLKIGNDALSFAARFGGVAREIMVPIERVAAIYARENGQGMGFEVTETQVIAAAAATETPPATKPVAAPVLSAAPVQAGAPPVGKAPPAATATGPRKSGKPTFTIVK